MAQEVKKIKRKNVQKENTTEQEERKDEEPTKSVEP